ncbi:MAG: metallophosphoesterase [Bacillota bacterium]|nr:metallophosphoesterase [Bacillota bacterium]
MADTLVMRFSDYEANTISEHQQVIAAAGSVWWGWWAKSFEPKRMDILQQVAARCPLDVGLLERGARRYYKASCVEIACSPDGRRVPSPDPGITPLYYRESRHPAWLKITRIESALWSTFAYSFGGIPSGDATLFGVQRTSTDRARLEQATRVAEEEINTPGDSILHLSDIHFGDDHAFPVATQDQPTRQPSLARILAERIAASGAFRIGVVVLSGDFITRGDANGYNGVHAFLRELLPALGLDKEHVVMAPGNHDLPLRDPASPTRDYSHEEHFRMFLRAFYGADIQEIERLCSYNTRSGWHLNFVVMNSARPRDRATMDYGYVGQDRYLPYLQRLARLNGGTTVAEAFRARVVNLAVLHHHLLPATLVTRPEVQRPVSLTLDAGQLVADLCEAKVAVALHGHQHVPFLGSTARARKTGDTWHGHTAPLYVVGAGSAGAKSERLSDEMRYNSYGVYTPTDEGVRIYMEEYSPARNPREYMDASIRLVDH